MSAPCQEQACPCLNGNKSAKRPRRVDFPPTEGARSPHRLLRGRNGQVGVQGKAGPWVILRVSTSECQPPPCRISQKISERYTPNRIKCRNRRRLPSGRPPSAVTFVAVGSALSGSANKAMTPQIAHYDSAPVNTCGKSDPAGAAGHDQPNAKRPPRRTPTLPPACVKPEPCRARGQQNSYAKGRAIKRIDQRPVTGKAAKGLATG